jgi:hypothetical protein
MKVASGYENKVLSLNDTIEQKNIISSTNSKFAELLNIVLGFR